MSEEELRQKMEFIVEQQAQFVVDIQKLQEAQGKLAETQGKLADAVVSIVGIIGKLTESQTQLTAQMRELAQAQQRTDQRLAETDERLNIFISVVEKYISERRNGRGQDGAGDESAPSV
jgi:ABC-type transporter Mla subunit MlaD